MNASKRRLAAVLLAAALALGCAASGPEAGRPVGGGPGGDAGNKPPTVVPHSKVFSGQEP